MDTKIDDIISISHGLLPLKVNHYYLKDTYYKNSFNKSICLCSRALILRQYSMMFADNDEPVEINSKTQFLLSL